MVAKRNEIRTLKALVIEQTASVGRQVLQGQHDVALTQTKTVYSHALIERTALASIGVNDQHLGVTCRMSLNKVGELCRVVSLIQHIAANDEIELAQLRVLTRPMTALVGHHGQCVQKQISAQKSLCVGVTVGGGDIAQTPVNDQTGQGQTASNFQYA